MEAIINKIIKFSNVDGPGNRMAIFLQGCNIHCKYCHNPETINHCNNCGTCIDVCPSGALKFTDNKVIWDKKLCTDCDSCIKICPNFSTPKVTKMSSFELLDEIEKVKNFISGITFSGGECSLNYKFITEVFQLVKTKFPNLSCFIDTNGFLDFSEAIYREFVECTDNFMLDVKTFNTEEHIKLTGKSNETIIKNLHYLLKINKLYEVRTVVVPDFLDNELTIREVSKIIQNSSVRYKLIKFRNLGVRDSMLNNSPSPDKSYMDTLYNICKNENVKNIVII